MNLNKIESALTREGVLVISEYTSKTKKYSYLPEKPKARFIDDKGRMRLCYLNTQVLQTAVRRAMTIKNVLAPEMDR